MFVLAIDPGDKHVGLAWALLGKDERYEGLHMIDREAEYVEADEALGYVVDTFCCYGDPKVMVIEEFRLYAQQAMSQSWDEMGTSEMIGALKYIAKKHDFEVVMQGASIKKSIRRQMPARGIQSVAAGVHAKDAELHLMNYLLKELKWQGN